MAGTLGDLKTRIALELARSDFPSTDARIANAINDAIAIYQKERFRFSETTPNAPVTFNTVAGQAVYSSTDNANIGTLQDIDNLNVNIGNTVQRLTRDTPENLTIYNQIGTMSGQPAWYALQGNQIIISPVPNQAYLVTIDGFFLIPAPASDAETNNHWMTDAERLIRARAKYEIAVHLTRNPTMAAAMSPDPDTGGATYREWKALKSEGNRLVARGIIRPMQF